MAEGLEVTEKLLPGFLEVLLEDSFVRQMFSATCVLPGRRMAHKGSADWLGLEATDGWIRIDI